MGLWIMYYFFNLSQGLQKRDLKIDSVLQVFKHFSSVQLLGCVGPFSDPMNRSTPDLPVHH